MAVNSVSSTSGFNVDGILSGLKTSDLITQLSSAERNAVTQLQTKRQKIVDRDKAYQDLNARVTGFQSALKTLLLQSSINGRTASSADSLGLRQLSPTQTLPAAPLVSTFSPRQPRPRLPAALLLANPRPRTSAVMFDSGVLLKDAGLTIPVTAGTFTVNGHPITIDPNTMTWAQVNLAIQTATGNAASLSFGNNRVSLVSPGNPMQVGT